MTGKLATAGPLAGRVILVTRAEEQAGSFAALLEEAGGRILLMPTIVIEPPPSWAPLDAALGRAREYQWAIFTSVNGVRAVRRRLESGGLGPDVLARCRVAAIGPATAAALAEWGLAPEIVPDEYVAESLVQRLQPCVRAGDRVLLARAVEARDVLVRALEERGAVVDEVTAYRTRAAAERAPELRSALSGREVDIVTFTSPSTVRNFAALFDPRDLGRLMAGITVACIGPITRAAAAAVGLATSVMPSEYTIPGLARAIIAFIQEQRS